MDLVFNVPINRVSFGNIGFNLIKTASKLGHRVLLFPIGPVDLSTFNPTQETVSWVNSLIQDTFANFDPNMKGIKLWHIASKDEHLGFKGHYERFCKETTLLSFYELDSPTQLETGVVKSFDTVFSSNYTCEVFKEKGIKSRFAPLGFDKDSFHITNKKYFADDRIVFAILGKFENRKHHQKIINNWVKRFGNDKRYYLQCAVYNPFFPPEMNKNLVTGSMEGKYHWNVNNIPWMPTNAIYNDFLNSNHIVIGMSGGEGWGLPEFTSVALGKHAVILNAHSYKDWANNENSVLVNPFNKISAVDGVFFREKELVNQGNIFDFNADEFISGCEECIKRYESNPINTNGLLLQNEFTWENSLNKLINNA